MGCACAPMSLFLKIDEIDSQAGIQKKKEKKTALIQACLDRVSIKENVCALPAYHELPSITRACGSQPTIFFHLSLLFFATTCGYIRFLID